MTTLRIRAEEYLAMRRRLGFKLTTFGTKLMSFIDYLDAVGATTITTDSHHHRQCCGVGDRNPPEHR